MSYLKNINKIKYDPELIKLIQNAAGITNDAKIIKTNELNFNNDKKLMFINKNNIKKNYTDPNEAERIEAIRKAIKNIAIVIGKIIIGTIIERFVDNKVNNFTLKIIKNSTENKGLIKFIDKEILDVYSKHPEYRICTLEQFKQTSLYNYVISEWRDKDARQIAIQLRKHAMDSAMAAALTVGIPIPGSVALMYPIKATLQYWGLDFGTSITELIISYKSYCLSMGVYLRPIGYAINNIILYSFKENNKLIATNLKDPPEDLYKITPEEARKILDKYNDSNLIKRDIDVIYSKSGMSDLK